MDLKRCANGHFYDGEKFSFCPHCQNAGGNNETIPFVEKAGGEGPTMSVGQVQNPFPPNNGPVSGPVSGPISTPPKPKNNGADPDAKTVGFFGNLVPSIANSEQQEPVVGWLVCTKGKHIGKDFRLKAGRNFIGRSADMDVSLEGENSVSRESHAIIAFEPHQCIFIAQPGAASELFYLNNTVVLSAVQVKRNDRLQIGETELMLIPCCDENFRWEIEKPKD